MAPTKPACGPTWRRADLRADLRTAVQGCVRTCVRLCASRVRTYVRLCAARFCGPHPPSPPSDWLSRGWGTQKGGTKPGEAMDRRSKIFSLCIRWARVESHGVLSSHDHKVVGCRWVHLVNRRRIDW
jgi:hypothetical protein